LGFGVLVAKNFWSSCDNDIFFMGTIPGRAAVFKISQLIFTVLENHPNLPTRLYPSTVERERCKPVQLKCGVFFSMVWVSSGQIFQQLSDYCGTPKRATVKAGVAWVDPGCTLGRNISSLRLCSCSPAGICEFLRGYPYFVKRQGKHGKTWRGYAV